MSFGRELVPEFIDLNDEEREIAIIDWILADDGTFSHYWYIDGYVDKAFYTSLLDKYANIFKTWNILVEERERGEIPSYPHRLSIGMEVGVIKLGIEYISDITGYVVRDSYVEIDIEKDSELIYAIVDALYYSEGDMYNDQNYSARV